MRACIYARKSTLKLGQKETLENQIKICKAKAQDYGLDIVDIKQDTATGTDDLGRPEVKQLIQDAVAGKYECVIMKGISRLYRDTEKGLALIKLLDRNGIRVITVEEAFDSQEQRTGTGKLDTSRITMYLMFSEMESKKLADRIKYTQFEKARSGEWNQASSPPFGYDYDRATKKLRINPVQAVTVRKIFELYTNGLGLRAIMHYLNGDNPEGEKFQTPRGSALWNQYTVGFIVKNQVYIGDVVYNKRSRREKTYQNPELYGKAKEDLWVGNAPNDKSEWVIAKNAHEAIITEEVFYRAQEILGTKASRKGIRNNVGLLAGIAKCGVCGAGMSFKRGNRDKNGHVKTRNNYYCMSYIRFGRRSCTSHHVGADALEQTVWNDLMGLFMSDERLEATISEYLASSRDQKAMSGLSDERALIESEISKVTDKLDKLLEKNLNGDISDQQFRTMNVKLSDDLSRLTDRLADVIEKIATSGDRVDRAATFRLRLRKIKNVDVRSKEQVRYLFLELIESILINEDGNIQRIAYKL